MCEHIGGVKIMLADVKLQKSALNLCSRQAWLFSVAIHLCLMAYSFTMLNSLVHTSLNGVSKKSYSWLMSKAERGKISGNHTRKHLRIYDLVERSVRSSGLYKVRMCYSLGQMLKNIEKSYLPPLS
jgi:hypothetical protein